MEFLGEQATSADFAIFGLVVVGFFLYVIEQIKKGK